MPEEVLIELAEKMDLSDIAYVLCQYMINNKDMEYKFRSDFSGCIIEGHVKMTENVMVFKN